MSFGELVPKTNRDLRRYQSRQKLRRLNPERCSNHTLRRPPQTTVSFVAEQKVGFVLHGDIEVVEAIVVDIDDGDARVFQGYVRKKERIDLSRREEIFAARH